MTKMNEDNKNLYIGIDMGLNGGICVIDDDEVIGRMTPMFIVEAKSKTLDKAELIKFFNYYHNGYDIHVFVEQTHTMPHHGGKCNYSIGEQTGIIHTILTMLQVPFEVISAKKWQKELFKGFTYGDTKEASISFCTRKYPDQSFKATERCKKHHDGMTDACCIAIYGKRLMVGKKDG